MTVMLPVNAEVDALLAESENEPDDTVMVAVPPTDCAAVNVAVYDVLLTAVKLLSVPRVALTSASANVDVASLAVNVTVDVPPELTDDGLALTVMVGGEVSYAIESAEPDDVLLFPARSVYLFAPIEIEAVPEEFEIGVNVAL